MMSHEVSYGEQQNLNNCSRCYISEDGLMIHLCLEHYRLAMHLDVVSLTGRGKIDGGRTNP